MPVAKPCAGAAAAGTGVTELGVIGAGMTGAGTSGVDGGAVGPDDSGACHVCAGAGCCHSGSGGHGAAGPPSRLPGAVPGVGRSDMGAAYLRYARRKVTSVSRSHIHLRKRAEVSKDGAKPRLADRQPSVVRGGVPRVMTGPSPLSCWASADHCPARGP
ncbi:hypothetical protein GCM10028775_75740 [Catellatospora paridis]